MKENMNLLKDIIWITRLGLNVVTPPVIFIIGAVWLRGRFELGSWIIWTGIIAGVCGAVSGLTTSLRQMRSSAEDRDNPGPISFNDHK